jgi:aminoglycoside phosphotransferase (APT) family kinase protein
VELLAAGRDADVFLVDEGRVLRRYRDGRSADGEVAVLRAVHAAGYPTPEVFSVDGPAIVMERVVGHSLAEALFGGVVAPAEAGVLLAELHDRLHALPQPGGVPLLHLDLHPLNVICSPAGPVVVDWTNARPGPAGLDIATTALILAEVVTTPAMAGGLDESVVGPVLREVLRAFAGASEPYADHLDDAAAARWANPTLSAAEKAALPRAVELARSASGA